MELQTFLYVVIFAIFKSYLTYIKLRLQVLRAVIAKEIKILGDSLLFSSGTVSEVCPSISGLSNWIMIPKARMDWGLGSHSFLQVRNCFHSKNQPYSSTEDNFPFHLKN